MDIERIVGIGAFVVSFIGLIVSLIKSNYIAAAILALVSLGLFVVILILWYLHPWTILELTKRLDIQDDGKSAKVKKK